MKRLDVRSQWSIVQADANVSKEIVPENNKFCRNFLDLLRKIFVYDPAERITAKQALQHPWFKEAATPDDGTEATKIRLQRQLQAEEALAAATAAASRHNGYRHWIRWGMKWRRLVGVKEQTYIWITLVLVQCMRVIMCSIISGAYSHPSSRLALDDCARW